MGNPRGRPRAHGWRIGSHGYRVMYDPTHLSADRHGYVLEHVAIAATALGKPLPPKAQVHHIDEIKTHNANTNLVVCQDRAYHNLLHQRMTALAECGNPDWRKCVRCNEYDDTSNLIPHGTRSVVHRACQNEYVRNRYIKRSISKETSV